VFFVSSTPQYRHCSGNSHTINWQSWRSGARRDMYHVHTSTLWTAMHRVCTYIFFFHGRDHFTLQRDFIQSGRAKAISACGRVASTLLAACLCGTAYCCLTKHQNHPCRISCFMKTLTLYIYLCQGCIVMSFVILHPSLITGLFNGAFQEHGLQVL
jgi:hypothetical protein